MEQKPPEEELRFASRMQRDWNARARVNAAFFVDFGAWQTEEEIQVAGSRDAEFLVKDIPKDELSGLDVLEIGCGISRILRPLSRYVKTATGIDVAIEMLRVGQKRLSGVSNLLLINNDGTGVLPFTEHSFDMVYSSFVFQHTPGTVTHRYLAESRRVLKPKGRLRFQFITPPTGPKSEGLPFELVDEIPEGVNELSKGPTFHGDCIPLDEMKSHLIGLGFAIEQIQHIGANCIGMLALLPS